MAALENLPLRASIYICAVVALGAAVIAYSVYTVAEHGSRYSVYGPINSQHSLIGIAVFMALGAMATTTVILIPEEGGQRTQQSLSGAAVMASIVVFPAYLAILLMASSMLVDQLRRPPAYGQRPAYRLLFNCSELALATGVAALLFAGLGGHHSVINPDLPLGAPQLLLALFGSLSSAYVVSYGLTSVAVALSSGAPFRQVLFKSQQSIIVPETTAGVVGILFGYLWLTNPPLSPVALLPLLVIYLAFRSFVRLQELDRLKSNFITEVSHELRTPLSAVLAASELLYHHGERLTPDNVRELSRSSYESSNHLFRLVENLLNATTLQSGTLHIRPVSVSMDELIGEAVTQVQPFMESKRQQLSVEVPHDLPEVLADPQHIVQVLINLLTNASKYSEPETTIGISCGVEADLVRIAVTDQGIGIPEDEQRRIFERFYRVPENSMTSVVGSGLGLTIVKSLVELHRGRVGVTSRPGAGSVFWFTLPQVSMAQGT